MTISCAGSIAALLAEATVTVVALDYAELRCDAATAREAAMPATEQPSADPLPARQDTTRPALPLQPGSAKLRSSMTFELVGDGKLMATGTITPGTVKAFADEVAKRGSYIRTVVPAISRRSGARCVGDGQAHP